MLLLFKWCVLLLELGQVLHFPTHSTCCICIAGTKMSVAQLPTALPVLQSATVVDAS